MDQISLGGFLRGDAVAPSRDSLVPWAEASWFQRWGRHFPLSALLGSRLEVLLLQGYNAWVAGASAKDGPAALHLTRHLSESLSRMAVDVRVARVQSISRDL